MASQHASQVTRPEGLHPGWSASEGVCIQGEGLGRPLQIYGILRVPVKKRTVRILLECFLVKRYICKAGIHYNQLYFVNKVHITCHSQHSIDKHFNIWLMEACVTVFIMSFSYRSRLGNKRMFSLVQRIFVILAWILVTQ